MSMPNVFYSKAVAHKEIVAENLARAIVFSLCQIAAALPLAFAIFLAFFILTLPSVFHGVGNLSSAQFFLHFGSVVRMDSIHDLLRTIRGIFVVSWAIAFLVRSASFPVKNRPTLIAFPQSSKEKTHD